MIRHAQPLSERLYLQIYPSALVNASRMEKIARSVRAGGAVGDVHLVGVQPGNLPAREEVGPGVTIRRIRGTARLGAVGQGLRALFWQPAVLALYAFRPVGVVACHNIWVLPMCWALAKITRAELVYNCHELETEAVAMVGLKQKIAKFFERRLVGSCALVSVVNESIADWYEAEYPQIARPIVVGNVPIVRDAWVDLRGKLGVSDDEMLYIHTGYVDAVRNIPLIVATFERSRHHVVFLGDGPLRSMIEESGRRHANIHWLPPVEPDLIVAHTREADVGLCLIEIERDLSDRMASPNKLLEALAANTPALCSDLIEARRLLGAHADAWILHDPEAELSGALERISKADVRAFRANWRGTTTWDEEVKELVSAIAGLAES